MPWPIPSCTRSSELADIVSPWTVGRYRDLKGVARHADKYWKPDITWCDGMTWTTCPWSFPDSVGIT